MKAFLSVFMILMITSVHANEPIVMNLKHGDTTFQITLPANPTTGYQWTVKKFDKDLLSLVSSNYISPKTNLIGAGGVMVYNFELIKGRKPSKSTTLFFYYARSWEHNTGALQKVTIFFEK